jgi:hypothetical protein
VPRRRRTPPDLLTLHDAAAAIGLSVATLRRHIRSGRLRAERIRGKYGPEYRIAPRALTALGLPLQLPLPRPRAETSRRPPARVDHDVVARLIAELGALREELHRLGSALAGLTARLAEARPARPGRAKRR